MRTSLMGVMLALCAVLAFAATTVPAEAVYRQIAYVADKDLKSACNAAGGVPGGAGPLRACTKENCDGKGGNCQVSCNDNTMTCEGNTPDVIVTPVTLVGILQNGNNVVYDRGSPPSPESAVTSGGGSGGGVIQQ